MTAAGPPRPAPELVRDLDTVPAIDAAAGHAKILAHRIEMQAGRAVAATTRPDWQRRVPHVKRVATQIRQMQDALPRLAKLMESIEAAHEQPG